MFAIALVFLARLALVALFLPFSAADKLLNFSAAVKQAAEAAPGSTLPRLLVIAGLGVEIVMSLGVLTGIADRACAAVLALYCIATAMLWKPFWRARDFRLVGPSQGREVFWDFLKNFAVAGGFLAVTLGSTAGGAQRFLSAPLASSHPYHLASRP